MEHYGTGSLWPLLCGNKVGLLSTGIWHCFCNDHKPLQKFLSGKNAKKKVNRWSLELATYNITFEWISGAHNKAADCLSQLVYVKGTSTTPTASINMLVTSMPDGPATCIHIKTQNPTDTTSPTDAPTTDKVNAPPPLTEDWKDTLRLMQRMDPFCKHISKRLLSGKAPSHEVDTFTHIKGLLYKHVMDSNKKFLVQVIPKSWHFMVLIEAHDKLGHQGVNGAYHLIKCQHTGKAWIRTSAKTSIIVHCVKGKRQGHRVCPLQMTDIHDRPSLRSQHLCIRE